MSEEIIEIKGAGEGLVSIILAGVHGDERCGVEALERMLSDLTIEHGTVFFGYGNPRAIEANKRYIEANLNRMFKPDALLSDAEKNSYEYSRAQFLKNYLDKADVLLDIHASSIPESETFVICEKNAREILNFLPVDIVVSGFDEVEPGGTDYYMNSTGKIGICLECGYIKDQHSIKRAEEGIFAFLKARGHISGDLICSKKKHIVIYNKFLSKTNNFHLSKSFENFEVVSENQLIGIDGEESIKAQKKSVILFAHNARRAGEEIFLLGEEKGLV